MRITDIRETSIALNSTLKNSSIDFSEMTTSVVAVITDVIRDGKPVVGFAFNSTGRYACGAQMRARRPDALPAPPMHAPASAQYRSRGRTWDETRYGERSSELFSLSPSLRGEGWGEGQLRTRCKRIEPLTRIALRSDLSP